MLRLLTLVLAGSLAVAAQAAVETHTVTVSNGGLTDFYATLDIPQHNEALDGDLISVEIVIEADIDGYFFYENLGGGSGGYQINENTWTFAADLLGGPVVSHSNTMTHPLTLVGPFDGVQDYAGTSGATVPYAEDVSTTLDWTAGDAGFSAFSGVGTVALDVATTVWSSFTTYGGLSTAGLSTQTTWTATVTYTYDPLSVDNDVVSWGEVKSLFRQ